MFCRCNGPTVPADDGEKCWPVGPNWEWFGSSSPRRCPGLGEGWAFGPKTPQFQPFFHASGFKRQKNLMIHFPKRKAEDLSMHESLRQAFFTSPLLSRWEIYRPGPCRAVRPALISGRFWPASCRCRRATNGSRYVAVPNMPPIKRILTDVLPDACQTVCRAFVC